MHKLKSYILTHKILSGIVFIALVYGGYAIYKKYTSTAGDSRYITAPVQKGSIISSVSGSGQISSVNQVDIKAKASGDVTYIAVKNGQKVGAGATIAKLDTNDTEKLIRDAEVNLESAKIALEKLKADKSAENMNADLAKAYEDGFNAVADAFLDLPTIITDLDNIINENNLGDNAARISGKIAQNYRDTAEELYTKAQLAFEKNRRDYRILSYNSPKADIENIINETYETVRLTSDATKSLRNYVDFMYEDSGQSSQFTSAQNTLSGYTSTLSGHLSTLLSVKTSIKDYKDAFTDSDLDIKSSELTVTQRENALQDAKDKLADSFIRAPFSGTVTNVAVKISDSVSSGATVATIITNKQLAEISLNEVDIAKIKIEQKTNLTFDAIPDLKISGTVAEIDTVGAVESGVVTYTVKISLDTQDIRVKEAMSVSADIVTEMKQDVLILPNSAVKSQNGRSYVESFGAPLERSTDGGIGSISKIPPQKIWVEIGISNDRETEIISGIKEGDEIITRTILPGAVPATTSSAPSIFGASSRPATARTQAR